MKQVYYLAAAIFFFSTVNAQIISIPDANFKAKLLSALPTNNVAKNLDNQSVKIDANDNGEIDADEAANISRLIVSYSNIDSFEGLDAFINLKEMHADANTMTTFDISPLHLLTILYVDFCPNLVALNLKNGLIQYNIPPPPPTPPSFGGANFEQCPALRYVCTDDELYGQTYLSYFYPSGIVSLNGYCSFTPGGVFSTIQGNVMFDQDGNGCDASDIPYPSIRFIFSTATQSWNNTAGMLGHYEVPAQQGPFFMIPTLDNWQYFDISPSQVVINVASGVNTYNQDFCVTKNGDHSDVDIVLLPTIPARPGFESTYKLRYQNKGNQVESGTFQLGFNAAVLQLQSAVPSVSSQTADMLTWNFADMQPFEAREVLVTFHLNSPMDTPPVNAGAVLNFTATVAIAATDEMPDDNTFALAQTVVNSFDPNDITCLEGAVIGPDMIGKYVHYVIRFENTGTANAQNIVVRDIIDTVKYNIMSLVPLGGSHPFVTKTYTDGKVEFVFENIDLSYDDASNDGYVAFKILTDTSLVLGDTFSTAAGIYFDYNLPVVTDPAVTTIAVLANQDFAFDSYFRIYPNPASAVLKIEYKQNIAVQSMSIYNTLGQLVLVVPNAKTTKAVDVSGLQTGHYFIKIDSDKGTSNAKFLKY